MPTAPPGPASTVLFLHGIGAGPESWDEQLRALPTGLTGLAPRIAGSTDDGPPFSLHRACASLVELLDERGVDRAHLCGLSLGAVTATRFAIDHPDRVASLVVSGGQVRPVPALMTLQSAILRLLPARMTVPAGMSKATMLGILGSLSSLDLRAELGSIIAPTLVLCGSRDRPNLAAARALAAGIPDAELQIVPGAGHEWNTQLPAEFSARLEGFLERVVS